MTIANQDVARIQKDIANNRSALRQAAKLTVPRDQHADAETLERKIKSKLIQLEINARIEAKDLPLTLGIETLVEKGFEDLTVAEIMAIAENDPVFYAKYKSVFLTSLEAWVDYLEAENHLTVYLNEHKVMAQSEIKGELYRTIQRESAAIRRAAEFATIRQLRLYASVLASTQRELKKVKVGGATLEFAAYKALNQKARGVWNEKTYLQVYGSLYFGLLGVAFVAVMMMVAFGVFFPVTGWALAIPIVLASLGAIATAVCLLNSALMAKWANQACALSKDAQAAKMTTLVLKELESICRMKSHKKKRKQSKQLNGNGKYLNDGKLDLNAILKVELQEFSNLPFRESGRHPREERSRSI